MSRQLPEMGPADYGRVLLAKEPLVFHCNYFNYYLQKTLLLDESLEMAPIIQNAATEVAYAVVSAVRDGDAKSKLKVASDVFAELGFGLIDFSECSDAGGTVKVPVSHYGKCMRMAVKEDVVFEEAQNLFDAGFAAGALAAAYEKEAGAYGMSIKACQSKDPEGRIELSLLDSPRAIAKAVGQGAHSAKAPPPPAKSNIDEPAVLEALGGLDFSGNEEGLIPRFGVMLTFHFANFYNRISFELHRKMAGDGLQEAAEMLLVNAGYKCGFHTFGGIMESPEWDAVVLPQIKTQEDWVHGITACVNALGWGVWRVHELSKERLVMRIWDGYESTGYLGMYGKAESGISFLAKGVAASFMNLIYKADIQNKPTLDEDFFAKIFEGADGFEAVQTKCQAQGDEYTEIVVELAKW